MNENCYSDDDGKCNINLDYFMRIYCRNIDPNILARAVDDIIYVSSHFNSRFESSNISSLCLSPHSEQTYSNVDEKLVEYIYLHIHGLVLVDNQLTSNWYTGRRYMHVLVFQLVEIDAIHTHAFSSEAFQHLKTIIFKIPIGRMYLHPGAFKKLTMLTTLDFWTSSLLNFHTDLLHSLTALRYLSCYSWPNHIGLNDLNIRKLRGLVIRNVAAPQTKFRVLTADNFTKIPHLKQLTLEHCGIEWIDEHAFDVIVDHLDILSLQDNRIKLINVEMFRRIFEAKRRARISINGNTPMACTCSVLEVNQIRFIYDPVLVQHLPISCMPMDDFSAATCDVERTLNATKICEKLPEMPYFYFYVHLKRLNDTILINTNFTSKFRMLFVDLHAAWHGRKCHVPKHKCLIVNKLVDQMDMSEITAIVGSNRGFIAIMAIPFLYNRKICPINMIMTRNGYDGIIDDKWISDVALIIIAAILSMLGCLIGAAGVVCSATHQQQLQNDIEAANRRRSTASSINSTYYSYVRSSQISDNMNGLNLSRKPSYEYISSIRST